MTRTLRRPSSVRLRLETLEDRTVLSTIVGLNVGDQLIRFDSASPGNVTVIGTVTGLSAGFDLRGIDFRPANGQLYGLAVNTAGTQAQLVTINPLTAAATRVGTTTITLPQSTGVTGTEFQFGFDFNPVVDAIRVVADNRDNFRINAATGAVLGADTILTPASVTIGAEAYTNNFNGATSTTLYGIDYTTDQLVIQGGNPVPPGASPNGGVITNVGSLGVDTANVIGFDIERGSGIAYASLQNTTLSTNLYTINLSSGAATLIGSIGASFSSFLEGLAIAPPAALRISGLAAPQPGQASSFTINAVDTFGVPVTNVNGTVNLTLTDSAGNPVSGVVPASITLTNGTASGTATFPSTGTFTLSASLLDFAGNLFGSQGVSVQSASGGGGGGGGSVASTNLTAAGVGVGGLPVINVYNADGSFRFAVVAFDGAFRGGVRVATADVTGDGVDDIIAGTATGASVVQVFDGSNAAPVVAFVALTTNPSGGVTVAGGDLNNDGQAEIIVGPGVGALPIIGVYNARGNVVSGFIALDGQYTGGVSVAAGDVNNDGRDDVIVGTLSGVSVVQVFTTGGGTFAFLPFGSSATNGVNVAAGDFNGDGRDEILVGLASGAGIVGVFDGQNGGMLSMFIAFPTADGGLSVAVGDTNGDGVDDALAGAGRGTPPVIRRFNPLTNANTTGFVLAFGDPTFLGGVFVG